MWVHEGFTAYSENLFLDYYYGKEASADYVIGTRKNIQNDRPVIGKYDVNYSGSSDMYYKGANLLHTIRTLINDDDKWRQILRGLNTDFYHQTVTTKQIEEYLSEKSGMDLSKIFDQYLRTTMIPTLEYKIEGKSLSYRYTNVVDNFDMPIKMTINNKKQQLHPSSEWKLFKDAVSKDQEISTDRNFYVNSKSI